MEVVLIGQEGTKRSDFFKKAVMELGHSVKVINWVNYHPNHIKEGSLIKIDPPVYTEANIENLKEITEDYLKALKTFEGISGCYLNEPSQIAKVLDKVTCKQLLKQHQIPITPMIEEKVKSHEELQQLIQKNKINGIFIKPRYGSGAAGVLAYRYHPKFQKEVIYTSMALGEESKFYNTKKMRRVTDSKEIGKMINCLLKGEVILERWVQKASYKGLSYDLRVVYQYGQIDFIVARGSKTPITNLHLNNCAINKASLKLPDELVQSIEKLCHNTMACFEGLNSAGIDILITPKGKPMVIEVNGQGDLIYQDLFNENRIYTLQMIGMVEEYGKLKKR